VEKGVMMPIFSFECDKCGNEEERMMSWSEDMEKFVGECTCGSMDTWKKVIKVSGSKTAISDEDRGAGDLIGHSWR